MNFLLLPTEVLSLILSFLPSKDLNSASLTCKLLNRLCKADQIWSKRCRSEFKIDIPPSKGMTRIFFQKVLYKYGHLTGLWNTQADCYGGLLVVKYENMKLLGIEMQLPKEPHITSPLRSKVVFIVDIDKDEQVRITCNINPNKLHRCTLTFGPKPIYHKNGNGENVLTRQCAHGVDRDDHQILIDATLELQRWLSEQSDFTEEFGLTRSQCIYKYLVLRQIEMKTYYSRLTLPPPVSNVPIQPGLFKGTYSAHGLELVKLFYEDDCNKVTAVKVTGDPNVPAGQITFRADLPYCMYLTRSQQMSIEDIGQLEPVMSATPWNELPQSQPYVKPRNCLDSYRDLPTTCKARFHGFGQIAGTGFANPSFVAGHWIIFNEDLFGFIWISLHAFSAYHRVKEPLC